MSTTAIAKLGVSLKLDNGNVVELREGDIVNDLVYRNNGVETTLSGSVRVIDANTRSNSTIPDDCPPEPYAHRFIQVPSLVIDSSSEYDAELNRVSIASILSIGSVTENAGAITVGVGGQYKALSEVLSTAEPGATIKLQDGEFTEALSFNKSVKIVGSANTVLTGPISVVGSSDENAEPMSLELENVKLSGNAAMTVRNVGSLTMSNCVVEGLTATGDAAYQPLNILSDNPMVVKVTDCTFGDSDEKSYNLLNIYGSLKSGSEFSNNTFSAKCCTNNIVNIYNADEGAVINIKNNHSAVSRNMARITTAGNPTFTVNLIGNSYDSTNGQDGWPDPEYAGIMFFQPSKSTTSFSNCTVNIEKTTMSNPDGQLYYMYAHGEGIIELTEDKLPTVYVDGVLQTEHVILPRTDDEIVGQ